MVRDSASAKSYQCWFYNNNNYYYYNFFARTHTNVSQDLQEEEADHTSTSNDGDRDVDISTTISSMENSWIFQYKNRANYKLARCIIILFRLQRTSLSKRIF